jgi:hypothetical protein
MLGVQTTIFTETFFTPYLDGRGAATINEIAKSYPHLVHQYCTKQEKGNITYIDPQNALIKSIGTGIREKIDTNNTFLITKEIFKWLKKSTEYSLHSNTSHVQPAYLTCQQKTGDCDDLTFLYISLCKAVGIPSRFISGYLCEESNGSVKTTGHVWAEVFVGGNLGKNGWIPVECAGTGDIQSEVNLNFGVEKSDHIRLFIDNGSNASLSTYLEGPRISYTSSLDIEIGSFIKINNYSVIDEKELVVTDYKKRSYKNI